MKLDRTWTFAAIAFVAIVGTAAAKWSDLPATGNVIDHRIPWDELPAAPAGYVLSPPLSLVTENNDPYPRGMLRDEEAWRRAYPKGPKGAGNLR
jgi:hypothetical protein